MSAVSRTYPILAAYFNHPFCTFFLPPTTTHPPPPAQHQPGRPSRANHQHQKPNTTDAAAAAASTVPVTRHAKPEHVTVPEGKHWCEIHGAVVKHSTGDCGKLKQIQNLASGVRKNTSRRKGRRSGNGGAEVAKVSKQAMETMHAQYDKMAEIMMVLAQNSQQTLAIRGKAATGGGELMDED